MTAERSLLRVTVNADSHCWKPGPRAGGVRFMPGDRPRMHEPLNASAGQALADFAETREFTPASGGEPQPPPRSQEPLPSWKTWPDAPPTWPLSTVRCPVYSVGDGKQAGELAHLPRRASSRRARSQPGARAYSASEALSDAAGHCPRWPRGAQGQHGLPIVTTGSSARSRVYNQDRLSAAGIRPAPCYLGTPRHQFAEPAQQHRWRERSSSPAGRRCGGS